jgi:hypothetical protein
MQTKSLPPGLIMRHGTIGFAVKEYNLRNKWWQTQQSKKRSVIAFYNTGAHLFFDSAWNPPTTYYQQRSWVWVPFKGFCTPREILASWNMVAGGAFRDQVLLQHLGHDSTVAIINLGAKWTGSGHVPEKSFLIPPICILYVAVQYGHVKDSLTIVQKLPAWIMDTGLQVRPFESQSLSAVSEAGKSAHS